MLSSKNSWSVNLTPLNLTIITLCVLPSAHNRYTVFHWSSQLLHYALHWALIIAILCSRSKYLDHLSTHNHFSRCAQDKSDCYIVLHLDLKIMTTSRDKYKWLYINMHYTMFRSNRIAMKSTTPYLIIVQLATHWLSDQYRPIDHHWSWLICTKSISNSRFYPISIHHSV